MSLEGAKFICLDEAGNHGEIVLAKGRKFTMGYYVNCDYVLVDERAKGIHCEIESDAFGRVSIRNLSPDKPILVNGSIVEIKRILLNNSKLSILDKEYLWLFPKCTSSEFEELLADSAVSTPEKQIGIPEQPPNSCPDFKLHRDLPKRFTVHNFAYCIQSEEDGNKSSELNDEHTEPIQTQSNNKEITQTTQLITKESLPNTSQNVDLIEINENRCRSTTPELINETAKSSIEEMVTPKMNLINCTKDKENITSQNKNKQLTMCHHSDIVITSFSPRETGVKIEKSFVAIVQSKVLATKNPSTPKSVYSTPKTYVNENDDSQNDLMSFYTPSTSKNVVVNSAGMSASPSVKVVKKSSMYLIDLTTPNKIRPSSPYVKVASKASAMKNITQTIDNKSCIIKLSSDEQLGLSTLPTTPAIADTSNNPLETPNSVISISSCTDASSVIEVTSDGSKMGITSDSVTGLKTPLKTQIIAGACTPKRTPHSLMKRALLTSAKKLNTAAQINTPNRNTPRRDPINRVPVRSNLALLRTPVTPQVTGGNLTNSKLPRRQSMSTPTRKGTAAIRRFQKSPSASNSPLSSSKLASRRSSFNPISAVRALTTSTPVSGSSQAVTACKTSSLHKVRKSVSGVPLSSHISKARRSIVQAASTSKVTSIKEKSPQQIMSNRLVTKARKSLCSTNILIRSRNMVAAAKTPTQTANLSRKFIDATAQSARKPERKVVLDANEHLEDGTEVDNLSRTFTIDSDEEENAESKKQKAIPKDITFSPQKEATEIKEKNNEQKPIEVPVDVEEITDTAKENQRHECQDKNQNSNEEKNSSIGGECKLSESESNLDNKENNIPIPDSTNIKSMVTEENFAEVINDIKEQNNVKNPLEVSDNRTEPVQTELEESFAEAVEVVVIEEDIKEDLAKASTLDICINDKTDVEAGFGEESIVDISQKQTSENVLYEENDRNKCETLNKRENYNKPDLQETYSSNSQSRPQHIMQTEINNQIIATDLIENAEEAKSLNGQEVHKKEEHKSHEYKPIVEDITLEGSFIEKQIKENEEITVNKQPLCEEDIALEGSLVEEKVKSEEIKEENTEKVIKESTDKETLGTKANVCEIFIPAEHLRQQSMEGEANVQQTKKITINIQEEETKTLVSETENVERNDTCSSEPESLETKQYDKNIEVTNAKSATEKEMQICQLEPSDRNNEAVFDKKYEEKDEEKSDLSEEAEDFKASNSEDTNKLLEEIEDVLNKSDEIKQKHLNELDKSNQDEEIPLTEESESEQLSQDEEMVQQKVNAEISELAAQENKIEVENVSSSEEIPTLPTPHGDGPKVQENVEEILNENIKDIVPHKENTENSSLQGQPETQVNEIDEIETNLKQMEVHQNLERKELNVIKKTIEKATCFTPRRSTRRASQSADTPQATAELSFTPRRSTRRASMSAESTTYTPTKRITRRASLSVANETPLTPKPITKRRTSISIDDETPKPSTSKTPKAKTPRKHLEQGMFIREDMHEVVGVILEEEVEPEIEESELGEDILAKAVIYQTELSEDIKELSEIKHDTNLEEKQAGVVRKTLQTQSEAVNILSIIEENIEIHQKDSEVSTLNVNSFAEVEISEHDLRSDSLVAEQTEEKLSTDVVRKTLQTQSEAVNILSIIEENIEIHQKDSEVSTLNVNSFAEVQISEHDLRSDSLAAEQKEEKLSSDTEINTAIAKTADSDDIKESIVEQDFVNYKFTETEDKMLQESSDKLQEVESSDKLQEVDKILPEARTEATCHLAKTVEDQDIIAGETIEFPKDNEISGLKDGLDNLQTIADVIKTPTKELVETSRSIEQKDISTPVAKKLTEIKDDLTTTPFMSGMRELLKTPKVDVQSPSLEGVCDLVRTPKAKLETGEEEFADLVKAPKTHTAEISTPKLNKQIQLEADTPQTPLMSGIRELLRTPIAEAQTPYFVGVRDLVRTPKQILENEKDEIENFAAVADLVQTPVPRVTEISKTQTRSAESHKIPSMAGMRELLKTPMKEMPTPKLVGIRNLMQTPKSTAENEEEQIEKLSVVAELIKTPEDSKNVVNLSEEMPSSSMKNENFKGVKELLKTPKSSNTPRFRGMRELMQTPKVSSTPIMSGVKELLHTPAQNLPYLTVETENTLFSKGLDSKPAVQENPSTTTMNVAKATFVKQVLETPRSSSTPRGKRIRELMETPENNSTPLLDSVKDLIELPAQRKDQELEKFLRTPTAKNLMIPSMPSSAFIEKSSDSIEISTEYDLNATNEGEATNLEDLFKTTDASGFAERITSSYYSQEEVETDDVFNEIKHETLQDTLNKSAEEAFDKLVGQESQILTPIRKMYTRKSITLQTPHCRSPFTAADVLSDLPKTDVEEWIETLDLAEPPTILECDGGEVEEVEVTHQQSITDTVYEIEDMSSLEVSLSQELDENMSMNESVIPETCTKVYLTENDHKKKTITSIACTETEDPLSSTNIKRQEKETCAVVTTLDAEISGIDLLDQTVESIQDEPSILDEALAVEEPSMLEEPLILSDNESEAEKTLNITDIHEISQYEDNELSEPLLVSDSEELDLSQEKTDATIQSTTDKCKPEVKHLKVGPETSYLDIDIQEKSMLEKIPSLPDSFAEDPLETKDRETYNLAIVEETKTITEVDVITTVKYAKETSQEESVDKTDLTESLLGQELTIAVANEEQKSFVESEFLVTDCLEKNSFATDKEIKIIEDVKQETETLEVFSTPKITKALEMVPSTSQTEKEDNEPANDPEINIITENIDAEIDAAETSIHNIDAKEIAIEQTKVISVESENIFVDNSVNEICEETSVLNEEHVEHKANVESNTNVTEANHECQDIFMDNSSIDESFADEAHNEENEATVSEVTSNEIIKSHFEGPSSQGITMDADSGKEIENVKFTHENTPAINEVVEVQNQNKTTEIFEASNIEKDDLVKNFKETKDDDHLEVTEVSSEIQPQPINMSPVKSDSSEEKQLQIESIVTSVLEQESLDEKQVDNKLVAARVNRMNNKISEKEITPTTNQSIENFIENEEEEKPISSTMIVKELGESIIPTKTFESEIQSASISEDITLPECKLQENANSRMVLEEATVEKPDPKPNMISEESSLDIIVKEIIIENEKQHVDVFTETSVSTEINTSDTKIEQKTEEPFENINDINEDITVSLEYIVSPSTPMQDSSSSEVKKEPTIEDEVLDLPSTLPSDIIKYDFEVKIKDIDCPKETRTESEECAIEITPHAVKESDKPLMASVATTTHASDKERSKKIAEEPEAQNTEEVTTKESKIKEPKTDRRKRIGSESSQESIQGDEMSIRDCGKVIKKPIEDKIEEVEDVTKNSISELVKQEDKSIRTRTTSDSSQRSVNDNNNYTATSRGNHRKVQKTPVETVVEQTHEHEELTSHAGEMFTEIISNKKDNVAKGKEIPPKAEIPKEKLHVVEEIVAELNQQQLIVTGEIKKEIVTEVFHEVAETSFQDLVLKQNEESMEVLSENHEQEKHKAEEIGISSDQKEKLHAKENPIYSGILKIDPTESDHGPVTEEHDTVTQDLQTAVEEVVAESELFTKKQEHGDISPASVDEKLKIPLESLTDSHSEATNSEEKSQEALLNKQDETVLSEEKCLTGLKEEQTSENLAENIKTPDEIIFKTLNEVVVSEDASKKHRKARTKPTVSESSIDPILEDDNTFVKKSQCKEQKKIVAEVVDGEILDNPKEAATNKVNEIKLAPAEIPIQTETTHSLAHQEETPKRGRRKATVQEVNQVPAHDDTTRPRRGRRKVLNSAIDKVVIKEIGKEKTKELIISTKTEETEQNKEVPSELNEAKEVSKVSEVLEEESRAANENIEEKHKKQDLTETVVLEDQTQDFSEEQNKNEESKETTGRRKRNKATLKECVEEKPTTSRKGRRKLEDSSEAEIAQIAKNDDAVEESDVTTQKEMQLTLTAEKQTTKIVSKQQDQPESDITTKQTGKRGRYCKAEVKENLIEKTASEDNTAPENSELTTSPTNKLNEEQETQRSLIQEQTDNEVEKSTKQTGKRGRVRKLQVEEALVKKDSKLEDRDEPITAKRGARRKIAISDTTTTAALPKGRSSNRNRKTPILETESKQLHDELSTEDPTTSNKEELPIVNEDPIEESIKVEETNVVVEKTSADTIYAKEKVVPDAGKHEIEQKQHVKKRGKRIWTGSESSQDSAVDEKSARKRTKRHMDEIEESHEELAEVIDAKPITPEKLHTVNNQNQDEKIEIGKDVEEIPQQSSRRRAPVIREEHTKPSEESSITARKRRIGHDESEKQQNSDMITEPRKPTEEPELSEVKITEVNLELVAPLDQKTSPQEVKPRRGRRKAILEESRPEDHEKLPATKKKTVAKLIGYDQAESSSPSVKRRVGRKKQVEEDRVTEVDIGPHVETDEATIKRQNISRRKQEHDNEDHQGVIAEIISTTSNLAANKENPREFDVVINSETEKESNNKKLEQRDDKNNKNAEEPMSVENSGDSINKQNENKNEHANVSNEKQHPQEEAKKGRGRRKKIDVQDTNEKPTTSAHSPETKRRGRRRKESHTDISDHATKEDQIDDNITKEGPDAKTSISSANTENQTTQHSASVAKKDRKMFEHITAESEEVDDTPGRRARNVPQRRAATAYHNYDETSDTELSTKTKKKTDSPRKSLEAAKKPASTVTITLAPIINPTSSPSSAAIITTARGRTRKPTAKVQQLLEEERAKAETPKKRALLAAAAGIVTTTPQRTPARRGRKASTIEVEVEGTPQVSKVRGRGKIPASHTKDESYSAVPEATTVIEEKETESHTTPPPANVAKGRKGGRKAKIIEEEQHNSDEPPAKKSPLELESEQQISAPSVETPSAPTRVAGKRNAAAAAKVRIEEDALAAAAIEPPKRARAKKASTKNSTPVAATAETDVQSSEVEEEATKDENVVKSTSSPHTREHRLASASTIEGGEALDDIEIETTEKPISKRGRKAITATTTDSVKRGRKAKTVEEVADAGTPGESKTNRGRGRARKNVHFDQHHEAEVTTPASLEEPVKRGTRARRK